MNPNITGKRLTSEFELLPVTTRPGVGSMYPTMRIQAKTGKTGLRAQVRFNQASLTLLGIKDRKSGAYVQVYVSNLGIKVVKARVDSEQARRINADGALVVNELVGILDLQEGDIWDCESYGADSKSDRFGAIIGSYPAPLREKINGAVMR